MIAQFGQTLRFLRRGDGGIERGLLLGVGTRVEHAVLDLFERDEDALTIIREGFLIGRLARREIGFQAAALKHGQRHAGADGEHLAACIVEMNRSDALQTAAAANAEGGEKRGLGHTDLRVGLAHLLLGRTNVRAALQQCGWQAAGHSRRRRQTCVAGDAEGGWKLTADDSERIFGVPTLTFKRGEVVPRQLQLRPCARHVHFVGETAFEAGFLELQRLLTPAQGVVHDLHLTVHRMREEIQPSHL